MPSAAGVNYHRTGSGPALLLMHGIGSRWQMWDPVLESLARKRDVIAIDLPGFGASPRPPAGTPAGVQTLTKLVIRLLDELRLERPHVAGNSLGGWLALELAKAGRAASATPISPAGFHNPAEGRYQKLNLQASYRIARSTPPALSRTVNATAAGRTLTLAHLVGRPWRMPAADAVANLQGLANSTWFEETLPAILDGVRFRSEEPIRVPVTVAWGVRDRLLIMSRQAPRAQAAIPSARIYPLPGCGHVPTWDDPALVSRVILEGSGGA